MLCPVSRARRSAAIGITALLAMSGCSSDGDGQVVVFAASSLVDVFDRLEVEFEATHPGVDVVVNAGGSSTLVAQLAEGAPADVLATADSETMSRAQAAVDTYGRPDVFAENSLVIAVETGNPLGISAVADLVDGPVVVIAAAEVPAGAYARDVLACEGVALEVASYEQSVRAAAAKVALGEADAAIVYRTDIRDGLGAVEIDPACNVTAQYPIVTLSDEPEAEAFVEFVVGAAGQAALRDAGFVVP